MTPTEQVSVLSLALGGLALVIGGLMYFIHRLDRALNGPLPLGRGFPYWCSQYYQLPLIWSVVLVGLAVVVFLIALFWKTVGS